MLEKKFEEFLTNEETITSKEKAVRSRMSKARAVERMLGESLDYIISADKKMYNALFMIDSNMNNKSGAYSNALRKYYTFKTGRIFPRIAEYNGY